MMIASGTGGDIVYVVSKNGVAAGPENIAYGAAKADQAHQVRLLASELGQARHPGERREPRRRIVEGSGIFTGALAGGPRRGTRRRPRRLGEFYASRTLLGEEVLPAPRRRRGCRPHRRRALPHHRVSSCRSTVASPPRSYADQERDSDDHAHHTDQIVDVDAGPLAAHERDLDRCARAARRRALGSCDAVIDEVARFSVAAPSWAVGTGGTRFGRFPVGGEPRTTEEKLDDIAALNTLTGANRTVSLHVPWDDPDDPAALRAHADAARDRLRRDELQHVPGQPLDHRRR